ncbi:hypothetical protein HPB49_001617 [Dermacentor silvarum]|uniref:Uncharacterized protein n=1 Tax=Dermacentor silvarum TaxID=543639 RepID=A0ACB8D246_DERSI|nr:hypothetical protein HPB49_001617 [Dermacentor silvarum]
MERSSVLWDPFCLTYLSWHDIEAITIREREPRPRLYAARNGLLNIDVIPDHTFRHQFRFQNQDLPVLVKALQVPDYVTSAQGVRVSAQEALCICLRRLAYPNRLCDLQDFFGRHYRVISSREVDLVWARGPELGLGLDPSHCSRLLDRERAPERERERDRLWRTSSNAAKSSFLIPAPPASRFAFSERCSSLKVSSS